MHKGGEFSVWLLESRRRQIVSHHLGLADHRAAAETEKYRSLLVCWDGAMTVATTREPGVLKPTDVFYVC